MPEFLEKELELEEEAAAQASQQWGDEKRCTFADGYKDQPIYSCETCVSQTSTKERFGFCFGCSMTCHVDHKVYELFEKRHFRCDCGTPKSGCSCSFTDDADKSQNNTENVYNHNFDGHYCYCDGIYDEKEMVMYQCIFCLDWFHLECIQKKEPEAVVPSADDPSDFMCCNCMEQYPFLKSYSHSLMDISKAKTEQNVTIDEEAKSKEAGTVEGAKQEDKEGSNKENGSKESVEECKLKSLAGLAPPTPSNKTFFWEKGWRQDLCRCPQCVEMYHTHHIEFLLQEEKEIEEEEEEGEETEDSVQNVSLFETSQQAFLKAAMPHSSKLDLVQGFNSFYSELKDYLKEFASSGREVTADDIARFSDDLRRKRRKLE